MNYFAVQSFSAEIIYSFVIIACSLMIYYGTKELYELSLHKGIKFFRLAFLFFAFAYFFRSFIKLILFYFNVREIFLISPRSINPLISHLTLILFMYFSTMSIFYFLYSVIYKKWNYEKRIYVFHLIAIVLAIFIVFSRSSLFYLGLNILLLLFVIVIVYVSYKSSNKKTKIYNLYTIYVLLLFFWILNILDILIPTFFQNLQLLIYLASSEIFLLMLYKVLKKTGSN